MQGSTRRLAQSADPSITTPILADRATTRPGGFGTPGAHGLSVAGPQPCGGDRRGLARWSGHHARRSAAVPAHVGGGHSQWLPARQSSHAPAEGVRTMARRRPQRYGARTPKADLDPRLLGIGVTFFVLATYAALQLFLTRSSVNFLWWRAEQVRVQEHFHFPKAPDRKSVV